MITQKIRKNLLIPKALPVSAHYKNPRNVMDPKIWKIIKSEAKKRFGFRCELCNLKKSASGLHAHEMYEVDTQKHVVTFLKVVALCSYCHRIQHMGLAGIHMSEGKINENKFNKHIEKNLGLKKNFEYLYSEFVSYMYNIEPWRRSTAYEEFNYKVKVNDFHEPLFSIWKEREPDKFWLMAKS